MKINLIKLIGLFFLLMLLHSCYNDCSDFECTGVPTFNFQILSSDSSRVTDSLVHVLYKGNTMNLKMLDGGQFYIQVDEPPAIKDKTIFDDSVSVFYKDTLQMKISVEITKTKGTCCDVYKLSKVIIKDSVYCTSNCTNVIYGINF